MNAYVRPALSLALLMTLLTGVLYPLAVTGVAQVAFPNQANGSLVRDEHGQVRGSALIAQDFPGRWLVPFAAFGRCLRYRRQQRQQLVAKQPGAG